MTIAAKARNTRAPLLFSIILVMVCASHGQTLPTQRTYRSSKADVEKALHSLQSYPGGKLPVLDGFADPAGHSLDSYKRGFYEYEVQVKSASPNETIVQVSAKVTAWYSGSTPGGSGYKVLKSSGRLESDLLDSLDDKLNPGAAKTNPEPTGAVSVKPLPDSPSFSAGSFFNSPRLTTTPSGSKQAVPKVVDPASAKQLQLLNEQAQNLEQILHNQVRPDNLAVVKRSNTPVTAQPVDGAEVLFQADGEDEFEVLDASDTWVHIKISGISRGWIKRGYVDLPGAATVSVAAIRDQHEPDSVRQTKEEVGQFPGKWEPLDGKQVKIIWVQPLDKDQFGSAPKWSLAKSVFRKADAGAPADATQVAGVVVIFDSQDGGMAATTLANLQQWRAGHLSDDAFSRRCWRDPADAFRVQN